MKTDEEYLATVQEYTKFNGCSAEQELLIRILARLIERDKKDAEVDSNV